MKGLIYAKKLTASGKVTEYSVFQTLEETKLYAAQKGIGTVAVVTGEVEQLPVERKR